MNTDEHDDPRAPFGTPLKREPVPVVTVCSITEPLRAAAIGSLLIDLPGAVQLSYHVHADRALLRRTVSDLRGMIDDVFVPMRHNCVCCSLTEEIVPTCEFWAERGRPIVLALPPTVEPAEIISALGDADPGVLQVGQVLAVVDTETLEDDLFGDDLLVERGLAHSESDRRAVGEALAHQLEFADSVGYVSQLSARTNTILDHLLTGRVTRGELHRTDSAALLVPRAMEGGPSGPDSCGDLGGDWRGNPSFATATGAADGAGVWTIELRSERPFSAYRLRAEIEQLGAGRIRGRGRFWVPSRPQQRCAWDGAGGQLSVGVAGDWTSPRETYLVVTGVEDCADRIRAAFERALLTDDELALGNAWLETDDGFDPWLGRRAELR